MAQRYDRTAANARPAPNPFLRWSAFLRWSTFLRWSILLASVGPWHRALAQALPDSPGALLLQSGAGLSSAQLPPAASAETVGQQQGTRPSAPPTAPRLPLCQTPAHTSSPEANAAEQSMAQTQPPCRNENPLQPIVTSKVNPLTTQDKGKLAFRDVVDPFNLLTIAAYSGFAVAENPHSPYGPGLEGWGRLSGYSFVEDAQGEFVGTFLICSLAHQDPRYHRMPNASVKHRILHAVAHTWVSQSDEGKLIPNFSTLLTYPISAELSNLYVPGVPTNLPATSRRVALGLATDPSGTLVAEFLPDIAKRIHIHVIFIQEILNQVITGGTAPNVQ